MGKHGSHHLRLSGHRWVRLRRLILLEEPLCRICKAQGKVTAADEIDHILSLSAGGKNNRENLQPLCVDCHKAKTLKEIHGLVPGCDTTGQPLDPDHHWQGKD